MLEAAQKSCSFTTTRLNDNRSGNEQKKNKNKINNNNTKIVSTNKNACVMYQINALQLIDIALFSTKYIFLALKCASSKLHYNSSNTDFVCALYVFVKFSSFVRFLLCQTISITCV